MNLILNILNKTQILDRLNEITSSYSFVKVIAKICFRDFCGTIDQLANNNPQDHLNFNEVAFLIGLWLKNHKNNIILIDDQVDTMFEEVYSLMLELHLTLYQETPKIDPEKPQTLYEIFNDGASLKETIFYDGVGAYDYQYLKWLPEKYKLDQKWLLENKDFDVHKTFSFYDLLRKKLQFKINNHLIGNNYLVTNDLLLDVFCLKENELTGTIEEYKSIVENLTLDLSNTNHNIHFSDIGDFNIFSEKPLIKLPTGKYFLPVPFCISQTLYETPFYWMNSDPGYSKTSLKNRGEAAENITYEIVKTVFGEKNIFKNVKIYKNKTTTKTDIDILAINENSAVVFQVKSKKLTSLSKKGNLDSITDDFKKAVKDAFEQGIVCRECLFNAKHFKFLLLNNKELTLKENIENCVIVTVVLDDYPAITHQTNIFIGEVFGEIPVSINIFDLEVVTRYLNTPNKFIEYISKRIAFSNDYRASGELSFLAFHLKNGLAKPKENDVIILDESWAQNLDTMYYPEIAGLNKVDYVGKLKLSRNEKCFCGSDEKYKYCHGKE